VQYPLLMFFLAKVLRPAYIASLPYFQAYLNTPNKTPKEQNREYPKRYNASFSTAGSGITKEHCKWKP